MNMTIGEHIYVILCIYFLLEQNSLLKRDIYTDDKLTKYIIIRKTKRISQGGVDCGSQK